MRWRRGWRWMVMSMTMSRPLGRSMPLSQQFKTLNCGNGKNRRHRNLLQEVTTVDIFIFLHTRFSQLATSPIHGRIYAVFLLKSTLNFQSAYLRKENNLNGKSSSLESPVIPIMPNY